ncbi:MAG: hypothetical protein JXA46_10895 [Dehalococcoidales bacterium]|nr:hypothetical protein [Dehalococcoidales bacterium]
MFYKRLLLICLTVLIAAFLVVSPALAADGLVKNTSNPVLIPEYAWEGFEIGNEGKIGAACVILEGGTYMMWYSGVGTDGSPAIGLALSFDGENWNKVGNTPVFTGGTSTAFDTYGVGSPCVLKEGTTYKMWYTGVNGAMVPSIGYTHSTDGLTWAEPVQALAPGSGWEDYGVSLPCVINDSGTYKMWYTGHDVDRYPNAIGYATSFSETGFARYGGNPVLQPSATQWDNGAVFACWIQKTATNDYVMYYSGYDNAGDIDPAIGKAVSADGTTWNKIIASNPVMTGGLGWDSKGVAAPTFMILAGNVEMWYTGSDEQGFLKIGKASDYLTSVPASSNTSTAILIGAMVVLIGTVSFWSLRRKQVVR